MAHPRPLARASIAASLLILTLLSGCGGSGTPASAPAESDTPSSATAETTDEPRVGSGGMTAIDAALGDGIAMPADSAASTSYDRERAASARESAGPGRRSDIEPTPGRDAAQSTTPLAEDAIANAT